MRYSGILKNLFKEGMDNQKKINPKNVKISTVN